MKDVVNSATEGTTTLVSRLLKWVDHNRYLMVAVVGAVLLFSYNAGCQGKAIDPLTGESATAKEIFATTTIELRRQDQELNTIANRITALKIEYDEDLGARNILAADADIAIAKANEQTEVNLSLIEGLTTNPLVTSLLPAGSGAALLLAGGLIGDNRRKDKVVKTLQQRDD